MASSTDRSVAHRIEEILRLRQSPLADELAAVGSVGSLPARTRKAIVDELGEEFCSKGLNSDDEANTYGLELEALTDACTPWRGER